MKKNTPFIIKTNLNEHPAVIAWSLLKPDSPCPNRIEVIKYKRRTKQVVKLSFTGEDRHSVIAKGTNLTNAFIEKSVYDNLSKFFSSKVLHYYGHVEIEDNFAWNFIEDAKGLSFSFKNPEHISLAEDWLAELHTTVPKLDCFPKLEINYYFAKLQNAYERITAKLSSFALSDSDIIVFKLILAHFDYLKEHWGDISVLYEQLPKGFIHGDFQSKNIRVRSDGQKNILLAFDWADSGWGLPGIDMHSINRKKNYWIKVRDRWQGITRNDIEQISNMGKILRQIVAINWASKSMTHEWHELPISWMKVFEKNLDETIQLVL